MTTNYSEPNTNYGYAVLNYCYEDVGHDTQYFKWSGVPRAPGWVQIRMALTNWCLRATGAREHAALRFVNCVQSKKMAMV